MLYLKKKNEALDQYLVDWRDSKNEQKESISFEFLNDSKYRIIDIKEFGVPSPTSYFPFSKEASFSIQQPKRIHGLNDLCMIDLGEERRFIPIVGSFIEIKKISWDTQGKVVSLELDSSAWQLLSTRYTIKVYIKGKGYLINKWKKETSQGFISIDWQSCEAGLWEVLARSDTIESSFVYVVIPMSLVDWLSYVNFSMENLGYYFNLEKEGSKYVLKKVNGVDYLQIGKEGKISLSKRSIDHVTKVSFLPSFLLNSKSDKIWSFSSLDEQWLFWTLNTKPWNQLDVWIPDKHYDGKSLSDELNAAFSQPLFRKDEIIYFDDKQCIIPAGFNTIEDVKVYIKNFLYDHYMFAVTIEFDQATKTWRLKSETPILVDFGNLTSWFGFKQQKFIAPTIIEGTPIRSFVTYNEQTFSTIEGKSIKNYANHFYYNENSDVYKKFQMHNASLFHIYKSNYNPELDMINVFCESTYWLPFNMSISTKSYFTEEMKYSFPFLKDYKFNTSTTTTPSMDLNFSFSFHFIPKAFVSNVSVPSISRWIESGQKLLLSSQGFQFSQDVNKPLIKFQNIEQSWTETNPIVLLFNGNDYSIEQSTKLIIDKVKGPFHDLQLFNIFGQRLSFPVGYYHGVFVIHSSQ